MLAKQKKLRLRSVFTLADRPPCRVQKRTSAACRRGGIGGVGNRTPQGVESFTLSASRSVASAAVGFQHGRGVSFLLLEAHAL